MPSRSAHGASCLRFFARRFANASAASLRTTGRSLRGRWIAASSILKRSSCTGSAPLYSSYTFFARSPIANPSSRSSSSTAASPPMCRVFSSSPSSLYSGRRSSPSPTRAPYGGLHTTSPGDLSFGTGASNCSPIAKRSTCTTRRSPACSMLRWAAAIARLDVSKPRMSGILLAPAAARALASATSSPQIAGSCPRQP